MRILSQIFLRLSIPVTLVIVASCQKNPESEIPEDVFERDSMVSIMAEIHIAEALLNQYGSQTNQIDFKAAYIQNLISKNNIDTARFNRSFDYYSTRPELFTGVYEDVINEISKRQAEGRGK